MNDKPSLIRPPINKSIRLKLITLFSDMKNIGLGTPNIRVSNRGKRGGGPISESLNGLKESPIAVSGFILCWFSDILIANGLAFIIFSRTIISWGKDRMMRDNAIEK